MKVIVTKRSFYGNKINKIGEIVTIKGNKLPSWAKKIDEEKNELDNNGVENKLNSENNQENENENENENNNNDDKFKKEVEENNKLNELLDLAIEKGIMVEFGDKSNEQLIKELEELLKEGN